MPKSPSVEERVSWHLEHEKECACRPIPEGIRKEIESRKKR